MIEPNLINDLPDMIQLAIMSINKPPKAVALELNCSISAIYQALHGKRTLPAKKMRKFAENNFIDAMIERDNISLNLFMELDIKFNLDLVKRIKKARFDE